MNKTNHKLHIAFILISLFVFSGCKKLSKSPIEFTIIAVMPHDGSPVKGIKWSVVESKSVGFTGKTEETDFELSGETDASGISVISFYPKKKLDYQYNIYFDYSDMNVPTGDYLIASGPTSFAYLSRNEKNDFSIRILPKMEINIQYKNLNCYDFNDTFKYKVFNSDERQNLTQSQIDGATWIAPPQLQGCTDYSSSFIKAAGHHIYFWEATRNGITETGIDTFYVAPGVNNVINMHW